jgi:hypothetical protein
VKFLVIKLLNKKRTTAHYLITNPPPYFARMCEYSNLDIEAKKPCDNTHRSWGCSCCWWWHWPRQKLVKMYWTKYVLYMQSYCWKVYVCRDFCYFLFPFVFWFWKHLDCIIRMCKIFILFHYKVFIFQIS